MGSALINILALLVLILTLLIPEKNVINANLLCAMFLIYAQKSVSVSQHTKTPTTKSSVISVTSLKTTSSTPTASASVKKDFSMSTQSAKIFAVMDSSSKISVMTITH